MGSNVGSKKNVKIFVLYLMQNINYPLDFVTLNDMVMQTDYVMYLDFAEAFHEMLDDELVELTETDDNGVEYYSVTRRGRLVASELKSDILESILQKSLTCALRYLDFKKRGISTECSSERLPDERWLVRCSLIEKGTVIFRSELVVDSSARAELMKNNFREFPEVIYRSSTALLAGEVKFLF